MAKLIEKLDSFLTDSKMLILLDAGHGGIVDGKYTTAPKKMYDHGDGFVFYEGVFNRKIVNLIKDSLRELDISFVDVVSSNSDVSLGERVRRANELYGDYKKDYKVLYLSVHGNAGKGTGLEVFTTKGETKSDLYAEVFCEEMICVFPEQKFRKDTSDGDLDKEAQFYVIRETWMPAVLTENFFFDRLSDAILMDSDKGQARIAKAHVRAIKIFEKNGGY
jgi:N-acetylmuramoyl-L-alanine amidase